MALVLQGRKNVTFAGSASNPASISLTSGWAAGAGGATYTPVAGDVVYVAYSIGADVDRDVTVVTSGYTELADIYSAGTISDTNLAVFRKVMGGTPDTALQLGPTGSNSYAGAAQVEVWSGADTTTPEDVTTTTATGTGTDRPNPPSITPTTTGAVVTVFGSGAVGAGAAFTQPGSELTNFLSANSSDTVDSTIGGGHFAWTSGAFDPVAWTGGSNNSAAAWAAVSVAIRPAPSGYSMTADAGSYSVTGTAANLLRNRLITADPATYTLTGTAANLARGLAMVAALATYSLTGTDASLFTGTPTAYSMTADLFAPELNPDTGFDNAGQWTIETNWTVSGSKADASGASGTEVYRTDVTLTEGVRYFWSMVTANRTVGSVALRLSNQTYGLAGTNGPRSGTVDLPFTSTAPDFGLFGASGYDGEVDDLSLKTADYVYRGYEVSFILGPILTADPGTYTLTGTAAGLLRNRLVVAAPGSYALTGTAATLAKGRTMVAAPGSYSLTGTAANLRESAIVMPADAGSYALTGTAANFLKGRTIPADPGSYAMTGTAANFLRTRVMPAAPGSYALTGTAAGLLRGRSITAVAGSYALTGTSAGFLVSRVVAADPGAYAYAGTDAGLFKITNYSLVADPGLYALSGSDASFVMGAFQYWVVEPDPSTVSITDEADPDGSAWTVASDPGGVSIVDEPDPPPSDQAAFDPLYFSQASFLAAGLFVDESAPAVAIMVDAE